MTDRLKPCPFCGGEARYIDATTAIPYDREIYFVECKECRSNSDMYYSLENAIKAWNTRKPIDRIVEQLEEEVKWAETHGTDKKFRHGRISGLLTAQRLVKGGAE